MDYLSLFGKLLRELNVNRLRRLLSIIGVIIGTAAVISSLAVVEGGRSQLYAYIEKLGVNVVFLEDRFEPEAMFEARDEAREAVMRDGLSVPNPEKLYDKAFPGNAAAGGGGLVRRADTLTLEDIDFLRRRFPQALSIVPQMLKWTEAGPVGGKPFSVQVEAGTPEGAEIRNLRTGQGRYLRAGDLDSAAAVCVLGAGAARKFFGDRPALDREVSAFGARWRVVGVLDPKGSLMRFDYDDLVIVPLTAMHQRVGMRMINAVLIQARDTAAALTIKSELLDEVLARLHHRKREDFQVFSQDELMRQKEETLRTFKVLTVAIAALSLLVSGIGIMNIMLVAVRERVREIGVWKAVGATDGYVLVYFLAESVLTCLVGGVLGIFLGVFLGRGASGFIASTVAETTTWTPVFKPQFFLLSVGTAVFVGLASGIFPALMAARLEPSEALRRD